MAIRAKWDPAEHPRSGIGRFISVSDATSRRFDPDPDVEYGMELTGGFLPIYEPDEEAALMDYTNSPWVNYNLRYGDPDPSLPPVPQGSHEGVEVSPATEGFQNQGEYREALDRAIERNELEYDTRVYRGVESSFMDQGVTDQWTSLRPGDQIRDAGYLSTSLFPEVVEDFGNVRMEIEVPAGTHVALPGTESERFSHQAEVLIGRGAVLEVLSNTPGANQTLRVRLVGYLDS